MEDRGKHFMFQAINGSGKTLAFSIPSILTVDPTSPTIQVIIIANTRELIRQVQQIIEQLTKDSDVTSIIGDTDTPSKPTNHILVTVPAWLKNRVTGRSKLNLSNLKMVVYDEADEIYF
jgi:ATP-dependent RNA helicase DDX6/DHH1